MARVMATGHRTGTGPCVPGRLLGCLLLYSGAGQQEGGAGAASAPVPTPPGTPGGLGGGRLRSHIGVGGARNGQQEKKTAWAATHVSLLVYCFFFFFFGGRGPCKVPSRAGEGPNAIMVGTGASTSVEGDTSA